MPGTCADGDILDLPTLNEPAVQGFIDGLCLELDGKLTLDHHVDDRSERSGDANSVDGFNVAGTSGGSSSSYAVLRSVSSAGNQRCDGMSGA